MPSCVVMWCKNNSSKKKKIDEVTFHLFPKRREIKKIWIDAIRRSRNDPSWKPTNFSKVCSCHFENADFYTTPKGFRRILKTEYPKIHLTDPLYTDSALHDSCRPSTPLNLVSTTYGESADVDTSQPRTSKTRVSPSFVESTDVNNGQPQTQRSATPIQSPPVSPNTTEGCESIYLIQQRSVTPIQSIPLSPDSEEECESDRTQKLTMRVLRLEKQVKQKNKLIKMLHQKVRRLDKRNKTLTEVLEKISGPTFSDLG